MKKRQQGLTTVEAAIGAALMLLILFATIEIARVVFVWNFLDEVTRRGARVAAVCPIFNEDAKRAAIFANPKTGTESPHVKNLEPGLISVDYWDKDGNEIEDADDFAKVRFVRVSVDSFDLPLLVFTGLSVTTPQFTTYLPSESLGYNPDIVSDPPTFECVF